MGQDKFITTAKTTDYLKSFITPDIDSMKSTENLPFSQAWPNLRKIWISEFSKINPKTSDLLSKAFPTFKEEAIDTTCTVDNYMKIYDNCKSGAGNMYTEVGYGAAAGTPILRHSYEAAVTSYIASHGGRTGLVAGAVAGLTTWIGETALGCGIESLNNMASQCARNTTVDGIKIRVDNEPINMKVDTIGEFNEVD